jgi:hypothetical protein
MDSGPRPRQATSHLGVASADADEAPGSRQQSADAGIFVPAGIPLVLVLAVQTVLSLRLVRADTAFEDEAAYLWAGHLEWSHWLHGAPIPPFGAYFSGAPVIYPPLGALADSLGGLAGARILSLAFMLGATSLLYFAAKRLCGRQAAFFAAILFAIAGPTLHLGSFATFDAMADCLLALSVLLVVRAGGRKEAASSMIVAAVVLALANATSYATIIYDPVVILLALVTAFPRPGGRLAVGRSLILLAVLSALLTIGLLIGGSTYLHGFEVTTVRRVGGGSSVLTILTDAWSWSGVVAVVALCGVAVSYLRRERASRTLLFGLLAVAAFITPADQTALHTVSSLNKHGDLGIWFAAVAAGYAIDRLICAASPGRTQAVTCGACLIGLAFPIALGMQQSRAFATEWPNSTSFVKILGPILAHTPGPILVEDPAPAEYYLHAESQWKRWSSTRNIVLSSGASTGGPSASAGVVGAGDPAAFARFIANGYFTVVALNFTDTTSLDHSIVADLRKSGTYRIESVVPYGPAGGTYVIYRYEPHL